MSSTYALCYVFIMQTVEASSLLHDSENSTPKEETQNADTADELKFLKKYVILYFGCHDFCVPVFNLPFFKF